MRISDWSSDVCSSDLTINGERVRRRLRDRQTRAAAALANSDVDLSAEQLQIVADIAISQAELAGKLLPAVTALGESADKVIDHIDAIPRNALRSAPLQRTDTDRKSVEQGQNGSVRVESGGCRNIKK